LLAAKPAWVVPFVLFLSGLDFSAVPSDTNGARLFEIETEGDEDAHRLIEVLDDLYADVRDGLHFSRARGALLERFVWHTLAERFPGRLSACALMIDGSEASSFRLDAATASDAPAVGIEAKASHLTLQLARGQRRGSLTGKVQWVCGLRDATSGQVAGAFVTWADETQFRTALTRLVGKESANVAQVVAHTQIRELSRRLRTTVRRLSSAPSASTSAVESASE
jgi:hypothetical protein